MLFLLVSIISPPTLFRTGLLNTHTELIFMHISKTMVKDVRMKDGDFWIFRCIWEYSQATDEVIPPSGLQNPQNQSYLWFITPAPHPYNDSNSVSFLCLIFIAILPPLVQKTAPSTLNAMMLIQSHSKLLYLLDTESFLKFIGQSEGKPALWN